MAAALGDAGANLPLLQPCLHQQRDQPFSALISAICKIRVVPKWLRVLINVITPFEGEKQLHEY